MPKAKKDKKKPVKLDREWAGQRWAFVGEFATWPNHHGTSPEGVAARRGALITETVDERLTALVIGDRRGTGRSEAKKAAARLKDLLVYTEAEFRELVRVDLTGKRFAFAGGFDCALGDGVLQKMVETVGGIVTTDLDDKLDFLAVGNRRGEKKIAIINAVKKLIEAGAPTAILDEEGFMGLVRKDAPAGAALDFSAFLNQMYGYVEKGRLGRAIDMLRKDRFQLYATVDSGKLVGVVRSQSGSGIYASWLDVDGHYGCAQPDLEDCMGLQGQTCKHLMVLVVGLARTGQIPMATALAWVSATSGKGPKKNDELCAETLLRYKGAEAGEVDWRPTETIPEDFYAL